MEFFPLNKEQCKEIRRYKMREFFRGLWRFHLPPVSIPNLKEFELEPFEIEELLEAGERHIEHNLQFPEELPNE